MELVDENEADLVVICMDETIGNDSDCGGDGDGGGGGGGGDNDDDADDDSDNDPPGW